MAADRRGLAMLAAALAMVLDAKAGCGHPGVVASIEASFRPPLHRGTGRRIESPKHRDRERAGQCLPVSCARFLPEARIIHARGISRHALGRWKNLPVNITQFGQ